MDEQLTASALALYGVGAGAALWTLNKARARVQLSLAKHPGLAGHPRTARRVAALLPSYTYDEEQAYGVDGAPPDVVARRRAAFARLVQEFQTRYAKSLHATTDVVSALSDLQFISAYRVPFQFKKLVGKGLKIGSFVASTEGVTVTDLDGNRFFDLTGSYGVNLLGNDFYKRSIEEGAAMVRDLGPVLGAYHPVMADNLERLRRISGMEEVSFHMSGTEAVMQAVRLSRYHSGRDKVVRFCGSYHGWWGDVQPGIGNPVTQHQTYTLRDMDEAALRVLSRRRDIACVLINPLQANNQILGYQWHAEDVLYGGHTDACQLSPVDHAAIAKACGCNGIRVETPDAFAPALKAALASDTTTVIDVVTDPRAFPPITLFEGKLEG
jgi:glutamate-1-semialdehyde 2,1-aminomutase